MGPLQSRAVLLALHLSLLIEGNDALAVKQEDSWRWGRAEHPTPLLRFPQTSRELQAVKNPAGKIASRLAGRGWKEVGGLKKQPGGFAKCSRPTPRSIEQGAGARLEPGTETLAEKQDAKCPRRRRPRAGFGVVMEKMHRVAGLRRRSWLLRALLERKEKFLHPELYGTAGTVQPNPTVSWCRARGKCQLSAGHDAAGMCFWGFCLCLAATQRWHPRDEAS